MPVKLFTILAAKDFLIGEINLNEEFYIKSEGQDGKEFGAIEAVLGSLAHWVEIENGLIKTIKLWRHYMEHRPQE